MKALHRSNSRADAARIRAPPVQITVRLSSGKRHPCLLRCELTGVVNDICSAASLVKQVGECVGRHFPKGPAMLTLALGIDDLVFTKKDGRYVCEDPVPGDVEVSDGVEFTVEAVDDMRRNLPGDATTSATESRGASGSGVGNNSHCWCQSRHGTSKTSESQPGSTRSRPPKQQREAEQERIVMEYLQSNPAAENEWEKIQNWRGRRVSMLDSLELFHDHVIPLTTLADTPPGSARRSDLICAMLERHRNGLVSLSQATLRLAWTCKEEQDHISQFISKASDKELYALNDKCFGGYGVAMKKLLTISQHCATPHDQESPSSDNDSMYSED